VTYIPLEKTNYSIIIEKKDGVMNNFLEHWKTFDQHQDAAKALINQYKYRKADDKTNALKANLPFEIKPAQPTGKACLLIHGLYDSPYTMRDSANTIAECGYHVISILLPGHGADVTHLLTIRPESWQHCVDSAVTYLQRTNQHIVLGGFSCGGALALDYCKRHANAIAGLILLSPAITMKSCFAALLPYQDTISKYIKRLRFLTHLPETDYARYRQHATNAAAALHQLQKNLDDGSKLPPLFLSVGMDDQVIDPDRAIKTFNTNKHAISRAIIYSRHPLPQTPRITYRPCSYPDKDILTFSHLSLPIAPDNPHYGTAGDFEDISHALLYRKRHTKFGELVFKDLIRYNIKRLLYNPDFKVMANAMVTFLNKLT
jgi:esterase/lipase